MPPIFRSLARILQAVAALLVGLALAYLVGMNLFLETRWFRSAIGFSPDDLRVEYTRAYSLLPGRIHVEGLSIRGSDTSVEWILNLDSCDFHVHFRDLLKRKFHADHVRGAGLSLRIRFRLEQEAATAEVVAALPPVPGFSDPPYLEIGPPPLPLTDEAYNLWTIQLDDVDAQQVRELWIHTLRYAGDMRVRGRWLFRPVRWLEVGPATVDVRHVDVSYGLTRPLLVDLQGIVEATVHPFDVRVPEGLEVLGHVSAKTAVSGSARTAELIEAFGLAPSAQVIADAGPVDLDVDIDHGHLRSGSHLAVSSAAATMSTEGVSLRAGVTVALRVGSDHDEPPVAQVDVEVSSLVVRQRLEELGRVANLSLHVKSPDVDLAHPSVEHASFVAEMQGAWAPSVAFLRPLFPPTTVIQSGVLSGGAHFEGLVSTERAHGALEYSVLDLSLARGANRIRSNIQGTIEVPSSSLPEGHVDLGGSRAALEGVVATVGGLHVRASSLALRAERALIQRGEPPNVKLDVDLKEGASIDLSDLNSVLPTSVSVAGGKGWVTGSASADLRAQVVSGGAHLVTLSVGGAANLVARGLRVAVGGDAYQGELRIALEAHVREGRPDTTVLSGSTVEFTSAAGSGTEAWWAKASIEDGEVQLADGPRFRAHVHVTAENASPVQALLARLTPVPRWVLDAFPTDDLHADGEVRGTASSLEAHSIVAKSSGTSARLEYAKVDAFREGMALVSAGNLRLGFTLAGKGQKFLLFGAESWFEHQVGALRARTGPW